jgi:hypothetical protein
MSTSMTVISTCTGVKPDHGTPMYRGGAVICLIGASGLPHAQRTRATPAASTSTAVPRWSTDWTGTARPPVNWWFVTRTSPLSTTAVSSAT